MRSDRGLNVGSLGYAGPACIVPPCTSADNFRLGVSRNFLAWLFFGLTSILLEERTLARFPEYPSPSAPCLRLFSPYCVLGCAQYVDKAPRQVSLRCPNAATILVSITLDCSLIRPIVPRRKSFSERQIRFGKPLHVILHEDLDCSASDRPTPFECFRRPA